MYNSRFPLAFSTLACPQWSLEQAAAAARQYGYAGLELRLLDGELVQPVPSAETTRRVKSVFNSPDFQLVCLDTSVSVAQPHRAVRSQQVEQARQFLELAATWNAPFIRVFAMPPKECTQAEALAAAAETLAQLVEYCHITKVSIALETHDAFSSSRDVEQVLNAVGDARVGVLWDVIATYGAGEPLAESAERLRPYLLHVHVKDGVPPAISADDWKLTLLGEGQVPVRAALTTLEQIGYKKWLSVEWEKKWQPLLAEPEIALPQYAEGLRAYFRERQTPEST